MQTLMNLCNCINAAAHARTRHVPWRDSRLTRVLSDVFDGQHVICLLAHTRYNAGPSLLDLFLSNAFNSLSSQVLLTKTASMFCVTSYARSRTRLSGMLLICVVLLILFSFSPAVFVMFNASFHSTGAIFGGCR